MFPHSLAACRNISGSYTDWKPNMSLHETRSQYIVDTMNQVKSLLADGVTVETLNQAKAALEELAGNRSLFPESDFPWPTGDEEDNCFCLHRDADGRYALYIDLINKGVSTVPHDHGDSWAIVTCIEGQEKHRLYKRIDENTGPGPAELEQAGEITISPGESVSLLVGGIHAIEAVGSDRSMMLHCYGLEFEQQTSRLEYDEASGSCGHSIDAAGVIRDFPLHPSVMNG